MIDDLDLLLHHRHPLGKVVMLPIKEVVHMTVEILDELDALKHKIAQQQKASEALWDLPED